MSSGFGRPRIRERPRLLEFLYRKSFPALLAYAHARGEDCSTPMTESMRSYTCQVVIGERRFTAISSGSKKEAREDALQAAVVALLDEEELESREEPSSSSSSPPDA